MIRAVQVTKNNQETIQELSGLAVNHLLGKLLVFREGYRKAILLGTYTEKQFAKYYEFVRTPAEHNFTEVDLL